MKCNRAEPTNFGWADGNFTRINEVETEETGLSFFKRFTGMLFVPGNPDNIGQGSKRKQEECSENCIQEWHGGE